MEEKVSIISYNHPTELHNQMEIFNVCRHKISWFLRRKVTILFITFSFYLSIYSYDDSILSSGFFNQENVIWFNPSSVGNELMIRLGQTFVKQD